jgi:hypothetical protein
MNIKPGDLIEWAYHRDDKPVIVHTDADEHVWSSVMKGWVPIGSSLIHLCISCDDKTITWLNEKGLFRARVDDGYGRRARALPARVVPRARG